MGLRAFLNKTLLFLSVLMLIFLSGCTSTGLKRGSLPEAGLPAPEMVKPQAETTAAADSRIKASHSLTKEGYARLSRKEYDGAIRLLERAVGVNPSDGPGYFYLSEAWIGKKNYKLAFQFNRLALIYLRNNSLWLERAISQKKRINEMQSKQ